MPPWTWCKPCTSNPHPEQRRGPVKERLPGAPPPPPRPPSVVSEDDRKNGEQKNRKTWRHHARRPLTSIVTSAADASAALAAEELPAPKCSDGKTRPAEASSGRKGM